LVLKWDARNEEKGKHGKYENLRKGPFRVATFHESNAYLLQDLIGEFLDGEPMMAGSSSFILVEISQTSSLHCIYSFNFQY